MILTSVGYMNHRYRFFGLLMRLTCAVTGKGTPFKSSSKNIWKVLRSFI